MKYNILKAHEYVTVLSEVINIIPEHERPEVQRFQEPEPPDWKDYESSLKQSIEIAKQRYLNADFGGAIQISELALTFADTPAKQAKVYELKIKSLVTLNRLNDAIGCSLKILKELNLDLKESKPKEFSLDELISLPILESPEKITVQHILKLLGEATYMIDPDLCIRVIWTEFEFSRKYGNSLFSAIAYNDYAFLLCSIYEEIEQGYELGKFAIDLFEKFNSDSLKTGVYTLFNGHVRHWKEPARNSLFPLEEAFRNGIKIGDFFSSVIASIVRCDSLIFCSQNLEFIEQEYNRYFDAIELMGVSHFSTFLQIGYHLTLSLLNKPSSLKFSTLQNNQTALFAANLVCAMLAYCFHHLSDAISHAQEAENFRDSVPGQIIVVQHNFYYSLALLAHYPKMLPAEQLQMRRQVEANQQQMAKWAYHAPMNFKHKHDLVEAERARLAGDCRRAGALYRDAIRGARDNSYLQEEALANELAGRFYLAQLNRGMAEDLLRQAYYLYLEWRAMAKVEQLEAQYPFLRTAQREQLENDINTGFKDYFNRLQKASVLMMLRYCTLQYNDATRTLTIVTPTEDLAYAIRRNVGAIRNPMRWRIVVVCS